MQEINDEEDRLKAEYRKLVQIRDADARKQTRIRKLKKMIAQMPKLPIPKLDEREKKAVEELEELEMQHNNRFDTNKIVNLIANAKNDKGKQCVEVDAMANVTYDPLHIDPNKETLMIMMLVRGDNASLRADLIGNIEVQAIKHQITTMIPRSQCRKKDVATIQADTQPKETIIPDTEDEASNIIRQPERTMAVKVQPTTSTSSFKSQRDSRKRVISYAEKEDETSESSEEEKNASSSSDEELKKKRTRSASTKKARTKKAKIPKTRAKDGRKLADVTNKLRDDKGRLMGYKPGTQTTTAKKSKGRTTPTTPPQDEAILLHPPLFRRIFFID